MAVEINRERFLSVLETSRELGLTPVTVRSWLRGGKLKAVQVGRAYLIPEAEVARLQVATSVNLTLQK